MAYYISVGSWQIHDASKRGWGGLTVVSSSTAEAFAYPLLPEHYFSISNLIGFFGSEEIIAHSKQIVQFRTDEIGNHNQFNYRKFHINLCGYLLAEKIGQEEYEALSTQNQNSHDLAWHKNTLKQHDNDSYQTYIFPDTQRWTSDRTLNKNLMIAVKEKDETAIDFYRSLGADYNYCESGETVYEAAINSYQEEKADKPVRLNPNESNHYGDSTARRIVKKAQQEGANSITYTAVRNNPSFLQAKFETNQFHAVDMLLSKYDKNEKCLSRKENLPLVDTDGNTLLHQVITKGSDWNIMAEIVLEHSDLDDTNSNKETVWQRLLAADNGFLLNKALQEYTKNSSNTEAAEELFKKCLKTAIESNNINCILWLTYSKDTPVADGQKYLYKLLLNNRAHELIQSFTVSDSDFLHPLATAYRDLVHFSLKNDLNNGFLPLISQHIKNKINYFKARIAAGQDNNSIKLSVLASQQEQYEIYLKAIEAIINDDLQGMKWLLANHQDALNGINTSILLDSKINFKLGKGFHAYKPLHCLMQFGSRKMLTLINDLMPTLKLRETISRLTPTLDNLQVSSACKNFIEPGRLSPILMRLGLYTGAKKTTTCEQNTYEKKQCICYGTKQRSKRTLRNV